MRDLIIGVAIVRPDGTRANGGGKVVKNVAGFDLPKLVCGSLGTLALIATVTFRVHPVPEHSVTVVARSVAAAGVVEWVRKVRALQLEPAAMLARRTAKAWDVFLRFEGFRAGVVQQREKLRDLEEAPAAVWAEHLETRPPVRFGALPAQLPQDSSPRSERMRRGTRRSASASPAAPTTRSSPPAAGSNPGPSPASLPLHRSVKQRMDPDNILAPGSFVGGL